jgi:hypothetical protein
MHWGTKWGAYDTSEWEVGDGFAVISYLTAWSPAFMFFPYVSKLFPKLTFKQECAEGGCQILGWETFHNGVVLESVSLDWESKEGKKLLAKFGFKDEEE